MADINVTPLVDVMLVLLIIFMITMPLLSHKIQIDLPQPSPPPAVPPPPPPEPIKLQVQANGQLFWNDEPISEDALRAQLRVTAQKVPTGRFGDGRCQECGHDQDRLRLAGKRSVIRTVTRFAKRRGNAAFAFTRRAQSRRISR
jgi:hypothetical protein